MILLIYYFIVMSNHKDLIMIQMNLLKSYNNQYAQNKITPLNL